MSAPSSAPGLHRVVATLLVAQIYSGIAVNCSGVYAPVVTKSLGIAPQSVALHVGLLAILGVLSGFLLNGAVARFGGVRTLQISLACSGAGFLLAATGTALTVLFSAVVIGFGMGMGMPAGAQLLAAAAPPHRLGIVFSIKQTGVPIAIGLAGVLIPAMLLAMDWRVSMLLMATGAVPAIALLQPLRTAMDAARVPRAPLRGAGLLDPARQVLASRELGTLAIAVLLLAGVQAALISFTVSYLNLELGYSLVVAGAALSSGQVAAVIARLVYGWWADRAGDPLAVIGWLALASAAAAVGVAMLRPAMPVIAIHLAVVLFSVTAGGWVGLYQAALVSRLKPAEVPVAAVGTQAFMFAGGLIGPFVFALISRVTETYAVSFAVFGVVALVACVWIFARRPRALDAAQGLR